MSGPGCDSCHSEGRGNLPPEIGGCSYICTINIEKKNEQSLVDLQPGPKRGKNKMRHVIEDAPCTKGHPQYIIQTTKLKRIEIYWAHRKNT